ncbi:MAG: type VI secretion system baseplate subunit TssK [Acidobacteria bacterium]|nr:type VI secretion system baseplate subunit TssK [Acidobacteriota bacterium]
MTRTPEVHFAEGMFLRPHHFQAAERHRTEAIARDLALVAPFSWGLARLEVATDQLEKYVFEVRALDLKLKDGTVLSFPQNVSLAPRTFKNELDAAGGRMDVHVGVPVWREGQPNALLAGERLAGMDRRFAVESVQVADENTGDNAQVLQVRRYAGRVFFGAENREGYETLPIGVIERSAQDRALPAWATDSIPPALEISAVPALQTICQTVMNRLEAKYRLLLSEAAEVRLTAGQSGNWEAVLKLQSLAPYTFLFQQLTRLPRIHPFAIYLEFARLAGLLSVFDDGRTPVRVPLYDHDRLPACFGEMSHLFAGLLDRVAASRFVRVDFVLREDLLVAALPAEAAGDADLYIGIESDLGEREVRNRIDIMKVGSVNDIPVLKQRRLFGLDLQLLKRAPNGLPAQDNNYYLMIEKSGPYWLNVVKEKVVAVSGALDPKLSFALYAVPKGGA